MDDDLVNSCCERQENVVTNLRQGDRSERKEEPVNVVEEVMAIVAAWVIAIVIEELSGIEMIDMSSHDRIASEIGIGSAIMTNTVWITIGMEGTMAVDTVQNGWRTTIAITTKRTRLAIEAVRRRTEEVAITR